jgi:hypothetical protein
VFRAESIPFRAFRGDLIFFVRLRVLPAFAVRVAKSVFADRSAMAFFTPA